MEECIGQVQHQHTAHMCGRGAQLSPRASSLPTQNCTTPDLVLEGMSADIGMAWRVKSDHNWLGIAHAQASRRMKGAALHPIVIAVRALLARGSNGYPPATCPRPAGLATLHDLMHLLASTWLWPAQYYTVSSQKDDLTCTSDVIISAAAEVLANPNV